MPLGGHGGPPKHLILTPLEQVLRVMPKDVPAEEWDSLPADLTDDMDHYLYGTPER